MHTIPGVSLRVNNKARKKTMRKRIIASLLTLCMVISIVPMGIFAVESDYVIISNKKYAVAPGITEYERVTNNKELTDQQYGYVFEIDADALESGKAGLVAGYNDYNVEKIKSGRGWGMKKAREQAAAIEASRSINVVGAVNGDFFNMSNGAPSGALVLNGEIINKSNGRPYFCIKEDGSAFVGEAGSALPTGVKEAVGGNVILVRNGKISSDLQSVYDLTNNPRTAVGIKADGSVVVYVVDGRQAPRSLGMGCPELAQMMIDLGCEIAINLDGGGSSTFTSQREGEVEDQNHPAGLSLRNNPSDGVERTVSSSLMIVSYAVGSGEFDHATIAPYQEVYTPGSEVTFTAEGVDEAGGPAELPAEGLTWSITDGVELGSIDEATGVFTANAGKTGVVTVALNYDGGVVGTTSIELRWPDKLNFTNTSVSLDFGESSDLSFNPTYMGRPVHYKNGDFKWEIVPTTYKYKAMVDPKSYNTYSDLSISLTGKIGVSQTIEFSRWGSVVNYSSRYTEKSSSVSYAEDGTVNVTSVVSHDEVIVDPWKEKPKPLQEDQTFVFPIAKFSNNMFYADENSSLRGDVYVSILNHEEVEKASVSVVIGMEPYVMMDFEDKGDIKAEDYWKVHVGKSSLQNTDTNWGSSYLTKEEMRNETLWIRDTTNEGVLWPKDAEGREMNRIVSSDENPDVRFGNYAIQLAWDFTQRDDSTTMCADFGFSTIVAVDAVQPTKLGAWINVPKEFEGDTTVIKAILVGGTSLDASATLMYRTFNDDGTMTLHDDYNIKGTVTYFQYLSYDAEGNVSGKTLSDWAGKGWVWVEADISSLQFPIGIQRGYTFRIVSAQNCTNGKGAILMDNLQMIYGTNTNDVNNPVVETLTDTLSGTVLNGGEELKNGMLTFEFIMNDSERSDKYATGINRDTIKVLIDGIDRTADADINTTGTSVILTGVKLKNGSHSISITVKDKYGNKTDKTYSFTINDDAGENAAVEVVVPETAPYINEAFGVQIINKDVQPIQYAEVTLDIPSYYADATKYSVVAGNGYIANGEIKEGKLFVTVSLDEEFVEDQGKVRGSVMATVNFNITADSLRSDTFKFSVLAGYYETAAETASFSQNAVTSNVKARYDIATSDSVIGYETVITVTDEKGAPAVGNTVYCDDAVIGTTDENGELVYIFNSTGRKNIYSTGSDGRAWNTSVVVNEATKQNNGYPFAIMNNAAENADTNVNITWFSALRMSKDAALIRISTDKDKLSSVKSLYSGETQTLCFTGATSGTALRLNSIALSDLTPNTTYYYQVGDGQKWSDVYSFTTASDDAEVATNFFVIADVQSNSNDNLKAALDLLSKDGNKYSFAMQTGDAIDDVTVYENWKTFFEAMNVKTLNGVPLVHTLGNHEYYGDNDGKISGSIYGLPKSTSGSFYSVEYGDVYVAVINNGGSLEAALTEMVADAAKTSCTWKVLILHEPIYGTNEEMSKTKRDACTALIEQAGIEFVFTGDDHAYARTYPMIGDEKQSESSRNGVVYYVCGDLSSKDNAYNERDYFACSMPHSEYLGMYLSVQADFEKMTVTAYDYEGNLLDSYTKTRTNCEIGNHTYDETSLYNLANGTLTCSLCGAEGKLATEVAPSGIYETTDGDKVMLVLGEVKTGWFANGDDMLHAGGDGIIHANTVVDTRTCLDNGYIITTCSCGEVNKSTLLWAKGYHEWNEDHVCIACGFEGIDINEVDFVQNGQYVRYQGKATALESLISATYEGKPLDVGAARNGADAHITYTNGISVGEATVTFEGRGRFYGEKSFTVYILPNTVSSAQANEVTDTKAALSWSASSGAGYYKLYMKAPNGNYEFVAKVVGTSYTVEGLDCAAKYSFKVRAAAEVEGVEYTSGGFSPVVEVTTLRSNTSDYMLDMYADVAGVKINTQVVGDTTYMYLPAAADLSALNLNFEVTGPKNNVIITGANGSVDCTNGANTVDLSGICDINAEYIDLTIAIDNYTSVSVRVMKSSAVGTVEITSKDAENEGREYVDSSKDNKTKGSMIMTTADGTVVYDGELKQIKARGNTTFYNYPKKSYQIKLADNTDIFGNGEEGKTYVLLAGYGDATLLHDKFFKDLAAETGLEFTPSCDWVDLYYDGEYRGTYLISEKNSIGETSVDITDLEAQYEELNKNYGKKESISEGVNSYGNKIVYTEGLTDPVDISGGYLLEINYQKLDEVNGFFTSHGIAVNIKSPEFASKEAVKYISEFYQEFEDALYAPDHSGYNAATGKYFYEYCDLDSLVKAYLINQISVNCDAFIKSFFFYMDNGILKAGPVWDMEMTCGTNWTNQISAKATLDTRYLADALKDIPAFMAAADEYYNNTFRAMVEAKIAEGGEIDVNAERIADSAAMNYTMWPFLKSGDGKMLWEEGTTYEQVVEFMKSWLAQRIVIMDAKFDTSYETGNKITLKDDSTFKMGEDGYLEIAEKVTADQLRNQFVNRPDLVVVIKNSEGSDYVGTGSTVQLVNSKTGDVVDEITVVVSGDVDGDGDVDSADYTFIIAVFSGSAEVAGASAAAADVNGDGRIGAIDASMVQARYI